MSKYFTPITELPGDSGKSQSASSMVQYKTVSNNKFEKKLAPNTKFVEPQKMFPESTNSPVSHSRKFSKRGSKITKMNAAEAAARAIRSVEHVKGMPTGGDALAHMFGEISDETSKMQWQNALAEMLHDSTQKRNFENLLYEQLSLIPDTKMTVEEISRRIFGKITPGKDASETRVAISGKSKIKPHPTTPEERTSIFSTTSPASTGATSSSASPTSSGIPGLPPASTSSSASTASSTPFTGLSSEKEIDVPHGVWNVGSHLKGVFGNIIPLATAPFTRIGRNRAMDASKKHLANAIELILQENPGISLKNAEDLATNFRTSDGNKNIIHLGGGFGASIGGKSKVAEELKSVKLKETRQQEFEDRLKALAPRASQFKRSAAALANDAAIIGGLGYAGYNLAFGDKNKNQSSPTPMQPTSMQPTPTTAFTPPAPMDLSQSKPLDKWKPVSDPSLMGKRMKKRGSVEKANFGDIATDAAKISERLSENASDVSRGFLPRESDWEDWSDYYKNPLTTTASTTKPSVNPFEGTLFDFIPSVSSSAKPIISRASSAIRSGASRATGAASSAIRSGASRAAGAASRAKSAAPSAIASSPRRFVNAVGVLGGPRVQNFGRGVADVFDSSKGKWLDRMQNAYEDMRGIKRPWETPTVNDSFGLGGQFGLGIDAPTKAKEPIYEIPYPDLDPANPDYRWMNFANEYRRTATDPRRAWRRNFPWVIAGAGALGTGAYYGLNALNSRNQNPPQLQPDEEIRAATGAPAPILTPAPAPAPAPAPEPEPQTNADGDLTTGDKYRDRLIRQKYENFVTFINKEGVLQPGKYENSDAKGQIDPRQLAETSMLVYGLIKENLPKLSKSTDKEISEFFDGFVQSQITEMQYNKAAKEGGFTLPKGGALGSYMPYLNDTQRAALSLKQSPTSTIYNGTDQPWWANNNFTVIDNTTGKPVEKSMGNKNKYGNDRSVIQKSMTSPVNKFSSTPKKNKYKDK